MTKLEGVRELAIEIFQNQPIRIAIPNEENIEDLFETLKSPEYSTTIGLLLYGAGGYTKYEVDLEKNIKYHHQTTKKQVKKCEDDEIIDAQIEQEPKIKQPQLSQSHNAIPQGPIFLDDIDTKKTSFWDSVIKPLKNFF